MNRKAKTSLLIVGSVGIASAISVLSPVRHQSTKGELAVPDHLRLIISRACRDCHTDQTRWPWYSRLPVVSAVIEHDVKKGREHLNFSTWTANWRRKPTANQLQEVCDAVSDNAMPPRSYRFMHPEARLSPEDVDALCDWPNLEKDLRQSPAGEP